MQIGGGSQMVHAKRNEEWRTISKPVVIGFSRAARRHAGFSMRFGWLFFKDLMTMPFVYHNKQSFIQPEGFIPERANDQCWITDDTLRLRLIALWRIRDSSRVIRRPLTWSRTRTGVFYQTELSGCRNRGTLDEWSFDGSYRNDIE